MVFHMGNDFYGKTLSRNLGCHNVGVLFRFKGPQPLEARIFQ